MLTLLRFPLGVTRFDASAFTSGARGSNILTPDTSGNHVTVESSQVSVPGLVDSGFTIVPPSQPTPSGATANRPTINLSIGDAFFDTALNLPIWVKTLGPPATWINAAGTVV